MATVFEGTVSPLRRVPADTELKEKTMQDSKGNPTTPFSGDIDLDRNGVNDWEEYGEEWVLSELSLSRKT